MDLSGSDAGEEAAGGGRADRQPRGRRPEARGTRGLTHGQLVLVHDAVARLEDGVGVLHLEKRERRGLITRAERRVTLHLSYRLS